MNWLHRNDPFQDDRDRYGYPPPAFGPTDMSYGYGYDSYAGPSAQYSDYAGPSARHSDYAVPSARYSEYDNGYEAAYRSADRGSSYSRSGDRYEPDEWSRHRSYDESPAFSDGYNYYDEEPVRTSAAYNFHRAQATTGVSEPVVVEASEDVLVRVRGAMVHLVDDQESPLLAEGEFKIVRIEQEGKGIVAIAKVGDSLQWPLTEDEPAVKLDSNHYFFTIKVPRRVDNMDRETAGGSHESLTYGITFTGAGYEHELDAVLDKYSGFSMPQLAHGTTSERDEFEGAFGHGHGISHNQVLPEVVTSSHAKQATESTDAEFWRTMAPNVDDYNSKVAKQMAKGVGDIIQGIFWLRDSTVAQLENGSTFVRGRVKPSSKPSTISPRTLRNLKRVRNMTVATEQVANSLLDGAVKAAGLLSGALFKSQAGKKFFQLLPGEVALVSMDAFAKVLDALEKAGTDVVRSGASFTTDAVAHRYGEDAGQVTGNTLSTAGHAFGTAWTATKLRSALNPAKFRPSKTGMLKAAAKAALHGGRS